MPDGRKYELFGETCEDGWEHDVWLMARRMAWLYHFMAKAIIARLGEEEGKKLIKDAIWEYGTHCGRTVREKVLAAGLPLTAENYRTVPDLPSRGWRHKIVTLPDGRKQVQSWCPLAKAWKEIGTDMSVARLYCWVDQSKICAYNGDDLECVHAHNVLDGDDFCEVVTQAKR
jgi:hypothetical protein